MINNELHKFLLDRGYKHYNEKNPPRAVYYRSACVDVPHCICNEKPASLHIEYYAADNQTPFFEQVKSCVRNEATLIVA